MKTKMDQMLRDWAARRTLDDAQVRALADRACREPARDVEPEPMAAPGWRLAIAFASVAAVAGLAVAAFHARSAAVAPEQALLSAADIRARTTLYQELGRLFGGAFHSAVLTSAGMQLDVESESAAETPAPLLLRLVVQRREGGSGAWSAVWHVDVLANEQDPVRVGPAHNGSLALWLVRTPDGRFMLDGSGHLPDLPDQLLSILNVIKAGAPAELQSFRQGRDSYRIVGVVHSLEART